MNMTRDGLLPEPVSDWRWAGLLLLAGLIVFMIGAGAFKPIEFQVGVPEGLRAMARYRGRIEWITAWMACGMILTTAGLAVLRTNLTRLGETSAPGWFVPTFSAAAVCMLVFLLVLRTVVLRVSPDPAVEIPSALLLWRKIGGVLFVVHMVLGYATWIGLGITVRAVSVLPNALGWVGIGAGAVFLLGFLALRGGPFSPPFILHVFTAATGVTLLLRDLPQLS